MCNFTAQIGSYTFQPTDRDWFSVQPPAPARWFARPVACSPENRWEHIRLAVEHVGVGVAPLRNQPDIFGNIGVGRACPLAIDNFMKVVRVLNVCGLHSITRGHEPGPSGMFC